MVTRVKGAVASRASEIFLSSGQSVEDALGLGGSFKTYDNYVGAKGDDGSDKEIIYLRGRDAGGDFGGGLFQFNAGDLTTEVANDPISIVYIAPTSDPTGASGAWVRMRDQKNVYYTSWGGVGNEVTDQRSRVQAMVDYLVDYDTLIFNTDFNLGGTVLISNLIGVTIKSQGCRITELNPLEDSFRALTCLRLKVSGFRVFGAETENTFDYTQSIGPSFPFIKVNGCEDCLVEHNIITGKSGGVLLTGGSNNVAQFNKHIGLFTSEVPITLKVNGATSFYLSGGSNNSLLHNYSRNSGTAILTGAGTFYGRIVGNFTIGDNDNGIYLSSGSFLSVTNNHIAGSNRGSGIKARSFQTRILGNIFRNCPVGVTVTGIYGGPLDSDGLHPDASIISGNHIESCGIGINHDRVVNPTTGDAEYTKDTIYSNNHLLNCGGPDIQGSTSITRPIRVMGGAGYSIIDNIIDGKIDASVDTAIELFNNPNDTSSKSGITIRGNKLYGTWENFIAVENINNCEISNNRVVDGTVNKMLLGLRVTDCDISHNKNISGQGIVFSTSDGGCFDNIISFNKGTSHQLYPTSYKNMLVGNIPEDTNFASSVASAPQYIGQMSLVSGAAYIAVDTASAAGWKQITV